MRRGMTRRIRIQILSLLLIQKQSALTVMARRIEGSCLCILNEDWAELRIEWAFDG